jgi:CheY-like chemotaxis protein
MHQPRVNDVLLVEDDPVSAAFLGDALQRMGLSCEPNCNGTDALRRAQHTAFRLLLLDVNLPGLSGPDLLAALRSDPTAASHTALALALTADLSPSQESALRARGFAAVGPKPLSLAQLRALLRGLGFALEQHDGAAQSPWDDARALTVAGGQHHIVAQLRALMLKDLPGQRAMLVAAFAAGDVEGARAELHRLRAACGFCGASALVLRSAKLSPGNRAASTRA